MPVLLSFDFPSENPCTQNCTFHTRNIGINLKHKTLKKNLLIVGVVSLAFTVSVVVKTNYYDLPRKEAKDLQELLGTDNLTSLDNGSLNILRDYIIKNLLNEENNFGKAHFEENHVIQKYFYHVFSNLPDFVAKKERHTGYYANKNESAKTEKLLAYSIYRLDRNPENLNSLFDYCRPLLPKLLPKKKYLSLGISESVNSLIRTYTFITKASNYQNYLDTIYNTVDTLTGSYWPGEEKGEVGERFRLFENSPYGHSLNDDYDVYDKYLNISKYISVNKTEYKPLWAFSFWVRRHKEGNMITVYEILNEVKKEYE